MTPEVGRLLVKILAKYWLKILVRLAGMLAAYLCICQCLQWHESFQDMDNRGLTLTMKSPSWYCTPSIVSAARA